MWKHLLENLAGSDTSQLSDLRKLLLDWRRLLAEAGLLLGLLAATSWLVRP
jgi:hypothetical protein